MNSDDQCFYSTPSVPRCSRDSLSCSRRSDCIGTRSEPSYTVVCACRDLSLHHRETHSPRRLLPSPLTVRARMSLLRMRHDRAWPWDAENPCVNAKPLVPTQGQVLARASPNSCGSAATTMALPRVHQNHIARPKGHAFRLGSAAQPRLATAVASVRAHTMTLRSWCGEPFGAVARAPSMRTHTDARHTRTRACFIDRSMDDMWDQAISVRRKNLPVGPICFLKRRRRAKVGHSSAKHHRSGLFSQTRARVSLVFL